MFGPTDQASGLVLIERIEFYVPREVARQRSEEQRQQALLKDAA